MTVTRLDHLAVGRTRLSRRDAVLAGLAGATLAVATPRRGAAERATPVADGSGTLPADLQVALTDIVLSSLAEGYTPGAIVGLWIPGQGEWSIAAGVGDLANGAPCRLDDHVRIASITKTFTATVVLQLVAEGKLALDDRIEQFVAGIPNGNEVTLRHLLSMTSGVYSYVYDPVVSVDYVRDPLLQFPPEQAIEIIRRHGTADFAPGEKVVYSDSNFMLLGFVVEQATGRMIGEEIEARVLAPLGLTGTSFATTPDLPEPFLHGYLADKPGDPLVDVTRSDPNIAWAAGAMVSTVGDLRRWCDALVAGTLLPPALQAERLTIRYAVTDPFHYGYGLGIQEFNGLLGHLGGILGYGTWMMHDPGTGTTLVIAGNSANIDGGLGSNLIFARVGDLLFPGRGFDGLLATFESQLK